MLCIDEISIYESNNLGIFTSVEYSKNWDSCQTCAAQHRRPAQHLHNTGVMSDAGEGEDGTTSELPAH